MAEPRTRRGLLGAAFAISLLAVPAAPATAAVVTCGTVVTTSITLTSNCAERGRGVGYTGADGFGGGSDGSI